MEKSFKKIKMTAIGIMIIIATLVACSSTNDTSDTSSNTTNSPSTGGDMGTSTPTLKGSND